MNATLLQHLRSVTDTTVSIQTVQNRLYAIDLYGLRPILCVTFTAKYRYGRRGQSTMHVNNRRNEWCNILSSEEFHFSVRPDNRHTLNWRERVTNNNPAFGHGSVRFEGGGMMVFASTSCNGRTDLHILRIGALIGH
ncbi:transposable element Tcb2 transposase [Trichonephila clavipes]|nr:transposable element Tcb2 transposase [Trichonephila clavipes]